MQNLFNIFSHLVSHNSTTGMQELAKTHSNFDRLPKELIINIFSLLNLGDINRVSFTCKKFNLYTKDKILWKFLNINLNLNINISEKNTYLSSKEIKEELNNKTNKIILIIVESNIKKLFSFYQFRKTNLVLEGKTLDGYYHEDTGEMDFSEKAPEESLKWKSIIVCFTAGSMLMQQYHKLKNDKKRYEVGVLQVQEDNLATFVQGSPVATLVVKIFEKVLNDTVKKMKLQDRLFQPGHLKKETALECLESFKIDKVKKK